MQKLSSIQIYIVAVVVLLLAPGAALAGATDAVFHNNVRQALNNGTTFNGYDYSQQPRPATVMPDMAYSAQLEANSAAVAQTCDFNHSVTPNGENLFAGSGSRTVEDAVNSWAEEVASYNYNTDPYTNEGCPAGQVCGHYTQIVWATSLNVGCSALVCNPLRDNGTPILGGGPATFVVCQYSPPGNFTNEKPYVAATGPNPIPQPNPNPVPPSTTVLPPIPYLLDEL